MSLFTALALLLTLVALSSYANHRFVGLPNTAALMLVSLLLSLGFIVGSVFGLPYKRSLEDLLHQVNLSQSLLGGVLSFLLFAGALNIDLKQLRAQRWRVFSLAVVSTLLSVGLAASLAYGVFRWLAVPILNALLFAVIGLQVVALKLHGGYFLAALVMIPAMLLTRLVTVAGPGALFHLFGRPVEGRGGFMLLIWGGLRGGVSVAMALSLPAGNERDLLLVVTYVVVAFSILVQGTTIPWLLRRTLPGPLPTLA